MIEETLNNNGLYLEGGIWRTYEDLAKNVKKNYNLTVNPYLKWDSKALSRIKENVKRKLDDFIKVAYFNKDKLPKFENLDIFIGMVAPDEIDDEKEYKKNMGKFTDEFMLGKNKDFNIINYVHCLTSLEVHRRLEKGEEVFVW